ncbi:unnamed protein product [Strongylus vulgaris]|uniref:Apoptosis regulator Bcl-2 family BH4 domain-containing protein n=1 Tax=Strongylus vulgaris TaxID=40348 RepID=A0A3P7J1J1_STRVU|nr:unnamed protein product [Strongylus vulgaris]
MKDINQASSMSETERIEVPSAPEAPDFEDPRLEVEGFVVDYIAWRIKRDKHEWYEQPALPFGTQPEHEMMSQKVTEDSLQFLDNIDINLFSAILLYVFEFFLFRYSVLLFRKVAYIFERRHRSELHAFADELLEDENLSFTRYCEIVDEFGRTADEMENGMSYGRLVGLISFGGLVAARLYARNLRREVQQLALYTAKFIAKRIRLTWVEDERSWVSTKN